MLYCETQAVEDSITVEQLSGAMTNMVYRCGLLDAAGVEQQVRLMLFSHSAFNTSYLINLDRSLSGIRLGAVLRAQQQNSNSSSNLVQFN